MGSISDKLARLANTKANIAAAIESMDKKITIPSDTPFRLYPDYIKKIATGKLTEKSVSPTGLTTDIEPPTGFDGFSKVTILGDSQLKPENIKKGAAIYGVRGEYLGSDIYGKDLVIKELDVDLDKVLSNKAIRYPEVDPDTGKPIENVTGYYPVIITPPEGLRPENIKIGVKIGNIVGKYDATSGIAVRELVIVPKRTAQTFTPTYDDENNGIEGFSPVKVMGDENLIPRNIRKGVTIFGVEGTYSTGESDPFMPTDFPLITFNILGGETMVIPLSEES